MGRPLLFESRPLQATGVDLDFDLCLEQTNQFARRFRAIRLSHLLTQRLALFRRHLRQIANRHQLLPIWFRRPVR